MGNELNPATGLGPDMSTRPLGRLIEAFVEKIGWPGHAEWISSDESSRYENGLECTGQTFRLYLDGVESNGLLILSIYFPFRVLEEKFVDTCMLFNDINNRFMYPGRLVVDDERVIVYKDILDTSGLTHDTAMIENMMDSATTLLQEELDKVAGVALTEKDFEEIRGEYDNPAAKHP